MINTASFGSNGTLRSQRSGSALESSQGCSCEATSNRRTVHLTRAVELGINHFDTAPLYGDGKSELNLGKVLDGVPPVTLSWAPRSSTSTNTS